MAMTDLRPRAISAVVMVALLAVAVLAGPLGIRFLIYAICMVMLWEWGSLVSGSSRWLINPFFLIVSLVGTAWFWGLLPLSFWLSETFVVPLTLLFCGTAWIATRFIHSDLLNRWSWQLAGNTLILGGCLSAAAGAESPGISYGQAGPLLIILLIIATDVGAYFTGRTVGGPKLAPRISPNKTWSGFFGGMAAAVICGLGLSFLLSQAGADLGYELIEHYGLLLTIGGLAMISVFSQLGDLGESWAKRRYGVKDASNLIPGHGGFLDRFDGYLGVVIGFKILLWISAVFRGG